MAENAATPTPEATPTPTPAAPTLAAATTPAATQTPIPAAPTPAARADPSRWAIGFTAFAGCVMVLLGALQAMAGLAALFNDELYATTPNYVFKLDLTAWGWVHLLLGILVVAAGLGLFAGQTWARIVGVGVALLSALATFAYIPYYPFWALTLLALAIAVIWALTARGQDITA